MPESQTATQANVEAVKSAVAASLADGPEPAEGGPHLYGAIHLGPILDGLDDALQKYVPAIGPLAPPQVAALAALIAQAVHLANQAFGPKAA